MQCQLFQSSWCYWHSFFWQAMQMHSQVSARMLEIKFRSIIWLNYSNQWAIQRMNQVANRFANQPNEWIWMLCFQTTFHISTMTGFHPSWISLCHLGICSGTNLPRVGLFRIPHKPPAGSLRVLHAPARRGGIRRASKTKINNLETDEFASNPPCSKNYLVGVISQSTFWREWWI